MSTVPRDADGDPTVDIEVDPRYALDAEQLAERIPPGFRIDGPLFLDAERAETADAPHPRSAGHTSVSESLEIRT